MDIAFIDPPIHDHGRAGPGAALCQWLDRRGVKKITMLPRTGPRVADVLTHFGREKGCEALVMGAFGHPRLREAILGGTTRDLLAPVALPLLMVHKLELQLSGPSRQPPQAEIPFIPRLSEPTR